MLNNLTSRNPDSKYLEINKNVQTWIIEDWTSDFEAKPTAQNLQTIEAFTTYAKEYYSHISGLKNKTSGFQIN